MEMKLTKSFIDILEQLEKTSSTLEKIELIKVNKDNVELKEFLKLSLDKNITFGIIEIPRYVSCCSDEAKVKLSPEVMWDWSKSLLSKLQSRDLTGNAAIERILEHITFLTHLQAKWFIKCLQKDLASIGLGQRLFEEAYEEKGFKFRIGLAEEVEELDKIDDDQDGYVDKKLNGYRTTCFLENAKVEAIYGGRNGLIADNFYFIKDELETLVSNFGEKIRSVVLDGEMHVNDDNHLLTSLYGFKYRSKDEFMGKKGLKVKAWSDYQAREKEVLELKSKAKFVIFDMIPKDNWDIQKYDKVLSERKVELEKIRVLISDLGLKQIEVVETEWVKNKTDAIKAAQRWIDKGFEGAIFKVSNGCYQWKRWRTWVKIKKSINFEVQLVDFIIQKPKWNGDGTLKPNMVGKVLGKDRFDQIHEIGTGEVLDEKTRIEMFNDFNKFKDLIYECSAQESSKVSGKYINPRLDFQRIDRISLED